MNPTLPPFVQESFDRGVDPIDDPAVQQWLLEHPEALASFAGLRQDLLTQTLRTLPGRPASRPRWHPFGWVLSAAAALILAAFLWQNLGQDLGQDLGQSLLQIGRNDQTPVAIATHPSSNRPLPSPDFASTGGVKSCVSFATEFTADRTRQDVFSNQARRSIHIYRCPAAADTRFVHAKTVDQEIVRP